MDLSLSSNTSLAPLIFSYQDEFSIREISGQRAAEAVLKPGASLGEGRGVGAEVGVVKANLVVGGKQQVSALLGASARWATRAGC